ncbi:MAG: hypothetical protein K8H86_03085, partial [Ignavibacteriaceae bacterium]|nr:hypothetical protein [Ignavibacteriaceae bacterium]
MSLFSEIIKEYFEPKIAQRGKSYFNIKFVDDVQIDNNYFTATVFGSKNYRVNIAFNDSFKPIDMHCTCPYFEIAECKHLAALLYYINSLGYFDGNKELNEADKIMLLQNNKISSLTSNKTDSFPLDSKDWLAQIKLESELASIKSIFSPFVY